MKTQKYLPAAMVLAAIMFITGCSEPVVNPVSSPAAISDGHVVIEVASSRGMTMKQADSPFDAGARAGRELKAKMGDVPVHAVIITEFFDGKSAKKNVLKGVCSVFDSSKVYGFSSYGSFGQDGCSDTDTVRIIGIGGSGIQVSAALEKDPGVSKLTMEDDLEELKKRLQNAGESISSKLPKSENAKLMVLLTNAHSPKNGFVVEGAHKVLGNDFPITGGSANKNPGQTYVYYQGQMFKDGSAAFMLSGDFDVSLAGRKATENSKVISTAGEAFAEAKSNLKAKPIAAFAFNCAGRKGKLDNLEDELKAIQKEFGTEIPIFGTYCAGEIGPADSSARPEGVLSSGDGWHLMVTVLGK